MTTPTATRIKGTTLAATQLPSKTPEQTGLYNEVLNRSRPGITSGVDYLSRLAGGDESMFRQLEAPALRQHGELQGQLASRFSSYGSGARRSSGHALAQSGAATDLAERLQGQRMNLQSGAVSSLMGLYSQLMGTDLYDTMLTDRLKKKPSWLQKAAGIGLPIIGGVAGSFIPGIGTAAGATAGSLLGQAFTG